jgi:hypothetical protein
MDLKKPKYPVFKSNRSSRQIIHPDNHHFFAGSFMKVDGSLGFLK